MFHSQRFSYSPQKRATPKTEAHIHLGLSDRTGPALFSIGAVEYDGALVAILEEKDLIVHEGEGIRTFADAVDSILSGYAYLVLHTAIFPPGEIRGRFDVEPEM